MGILSEGFISVMQTLCEGKSVYHFIILMSYFKIFITKTIEQVLFVLKEMMKPFPHISVFCNTRYQHLYILRKEIKFFNEPLSLRTNEILISSIKR